jgi:hypothetical protein
MRSAIFLAAIGLLSSDAAFAQNGNPSKTGRRIMLSRDYEITLARSAAPPSVSAWARVLVFTDSGYVVADSGSSGVTCVVNRSWPQALEPHCYDAEGAGSVMPPELRRAELAHRGVAQADIDREIAAGLASGRYRMPQRPALTYMMSAGQVLYDDSGRRVGSWKPHLMLYYPYLKSAELGLSSKDAGRIGSVSQGGTPASSLVIIVQDFVPAPASP